MTSISPAPGALLSIAFKTCGWEVSELLHQDIDVIDSEQSGGACDFIAVIFQDETGRSIQQRAETRNHTLDLLDKHQPSGGGVH